MATNVLYNIAQIKVFDYTQPGAISTTVDFDTDFTASAGDDEKQGFDTRLATSTGDYASVDLGYTQGGGTLSQEVTELEVRADQASDPVTTLIKDSTKTLNFTLLNVTPANLALAFAGEVDVSDPNTMNFSRLPSGVVKSVYIKTKTVDGKYFEVKIPKAKIKGNSSVSFSADNATNLPVEMTILTPDTTGVEPIKIVTKTAT
jgi:hypothetical protein